MRTETGKLVYRKKNGFKTMFKRMGESVVGEATRLRQRQTVRVGVSFQIRVGETNAPVKEQTTATIASIGEIIRAKLAKVAEGETRSGVD